MLIDQFNGGILWARSWAGFSDCRTYRYTLARRWDGRPPLAFCMLNPSTADAQSNDPTVERCERRARMWGYGGVTVVNLFGLRSTDPAALYDVTDPVGPENFDAIRNAAEEHAVLVCAWGGHGAYMGMGELVLRRLREFYPGRAHYLKLNGDGSPSHPLYLPYELSPQPFNINRG